MPVCAPPDEAFAQRPGGVGVPLVPLAPSARAPTRAAAPASPLPRRAAQVIAARTESVISAAGGGDVVVATGMRPAASDGIDALFGEAPNTHRTVIGLPPAGHVRDHAVDGRAGGVPGGR
ncbi:hypothetical protein [Streptomyces sp. NPDC014006]|uniref:hypothetical protein n=1 Tax=Streptomyces sp. NPDC014006 TaxID=3364870 RepID=UPI0036FA0C73